MSATKPSRAAVRAWHRYLNRVKGEDIPMAAIIDAEFAPVVEALRELYAVVQGECPSLLNEDSGGSARLDSQIREALEIK